MRVTIGANGAAHLDDVHDLNRLDVVAPDPDRLKQGFAHHGKVEGEHVWISQAWLASHGPADDEAWHDGFAKMIAYAQRKGWTQPDGSVRAHVTLTATM